MADYLRISIGELIHGNSGNPLVSPEALEMERSLKLQQIIHVLQDTQEKLDALETSLDIKNIPSGGGNPRKLLKAQM